jgi:hypothetical protein
MVEVTLSMVILFLLGVVAITVRGGWNLQKELNDCKRYAGIVTRFAREISDLPEDVVNVRFKNYVDTELKRMKGR